MKTGITYLGVKGNYILKNVGKVFSEKDDSDKNSSHVALMISCLLNAI
jgi:hypothetical protein